MKLLDAISTILGIIAHIALAIPMLLLLAAIIYGVIHTV